MNRNLLIAIIVLALGAGFLIYLSISRMPAAPIKPQPTLVPTAMPTPTPRQLVVPLSEENKSGETGTATITEDHGKLMVSLMLTGAASGVSQPAHIHIGKCPGVGAVKYPLTSLVDGKSDTTIDKVTTIDDLLAQLPLAINVHKSTAAPSVYVACGEIQSSETRMHASPGVTGMMHDTPTLTGMMMHENTTSATTPTSTH